MEEKKEKKEEGDKQTKSKQTPRKQSKPGHRGGKKEPRAASTADVAEAAAATLSEMNEQISERERERTGFTRDEKQESRDFIKGIGKSFVRMLVHPIMFLLENVWLLHSILTSLSFVLINPWMLITRIIAEVGITQQVMNDGIISLGLQVQYLLSFMQFFNVVSILRRK